MNYWVRFWVVVVSAMVGLSALCFLAGSFLFPDADIFDVGSAGRLAVTMVAVVSFSVVVWTGISNDAGAGTVGPRSGR